MKRDNPELLAYGPVVLTHRILRSPLVKFLSTLQSSALGLSSELQARIQLDQAEITDDGYFTNATSHCVDAIELGL